MDITSLKDSGAILLNNWPTLSIVFLIFLISRWTLNRNYAFQTLNRHGIPGPKPNFLFGNIDEMTGIGTKKLVKIEEWIKKYGKVFGYYRATIPIIVVTEPEIIENILIEDFDSFTDRPKYLRIHAGPFKHMLTSLTQDRWKEVRSVLTPTFSSKKMKQMSPLINSAVDILIEILEDKIQKNEDCNLKNIYQGLTLHVIGECAFGLKIDCQKNPLDPFLIVIRNFFDSNRNYLATLWNTFPKFKMIVRILTPGNTSWLYWLQKQLVNVIQLRRQNLEENRVDVLQLMLNAANRRPSFTRRFSMDEANINDTINLTTPLRSLTANEVESQAFNFLLAGFETTANTLTYITHVLTKYPEIQRKLQEEVDDNFPPDKILDYESVQSLLYMEQVVQETLRLYPPLPLFITRLCTKEYKTNGFVFPKDCEVLVPVWNIHHDPNIWPNPELFNPERFTPEEKRSMSPTAWMPFGVGPRNCIGMRFAILEIKVALVRILQKYSFSKGDKFKENIELQCPGSLLQPKGDIYVKVARRNQK